MNIAEALEKAGYGDDLERKTVEENPGRGDTQPEVSPGGPNQGPGRPAKCDSAQWDERLFKAVNHDIHLPEVFKQLRARILHPINGETVPKTVLVTSAVPREGKSFVAANLGISLAHGLEQHSLLVDGDLRRPAMARMFGLDNRTGLVDYLRDGVPLSSLIKRTSVNALSVLPSGIVPANPAELLSSSRMAALVEELAGRYEDRIIIFDSPPMLVAAESSVLAGQVDAVILVVRQSTSGKAQLQRLIDLIGTERLLGVVFNDQQVNRLQKKIIKGYATYNGSY